MGIVLTHERWVKEDLDALEAQGVRVVREDPMAGVDLPAPQYGEAIIGELTHSEATVFRALYDIKNEMDRVDRQLQGRMMQRMGEAVANADPMKGSFVHVDPAELQGQFQPEELQAYFQKRQTAGYLHARLHWMLGERLKLHHWALGIRRGGKIVKIEQRPIGQ